MKFNLKYFTISCIILVLSLASCSENKTSGKKENSDSDVRFDAYKTNWVERLWRLHPDWASSVGFHTYDNVLVIPDSSRRSSVAKTYNGMLRELARFKPEELSPNNQTDLQMIRSFLKAATWQESVLKSWQWDPSNYNLASPVAEILNGRYADLDTRLRAISDKIDKSPVYYEAAIASLENPTLEHTQLAILQNRGGAELFGNQLTDSIKRSTLDPREKEILMLRAQTTRMAINSYVRYLEQNILPEVKNGQGPSFRIGKEMFARKFEHEIQSRFTADEIYHKALHHKKELHREMVKLSTQLWPKYFKEAAPADSMQMVRKMIYKLSEKHVSRDSFITAIRQQIPELVAFVNAKKLLTQDPGKPLVVRETPLYMRGGGAGASISAPGPYDPKANTYYNVTPLDGYTSEQAESYLREYNPYTLQILNIHEAIPGHYTQLVYSNKAPSIIKAILGNGAMVEGWAVYAERMMLDAGYKKSPEMELMYAKWHMRVTLNSILDYSVHCLDMSEKDAMALLQNEGFQEEAEASGKWKRAKLSQVQLCSYFTGFTEIMALRDEVKKEQGDDFSLKNFHETFLSYGSAPVKYIRELMLKKK